MSARLKGINVVVTRPAHQAEALCERLAAEGAGVIRFPVLEITEPKDKNAFYAIIDNLADFDLGIFISPNAVNRALPQILSRGGFPQHLLIAAVGRGSTRALDKFDKTADIFPESAFNSEALLALPELQAVRSKKIVIFKGEGGRELLANTLKDRGAEVVNAECYRRIKPQIDVSPLLKHWQQDEVHLIIVTSNDGLQNLHDMVGSQGYSYLRQTPLVVISERMCEFSKTLKFDHTPIVADSASDEALFNAVITWHSEAQRSTIS